MLTKTTMPEFLDKESFSQILKANSIFPQKFHYIVTVFLYRLFILISEGKITINSLKKLELTNEHVERLLFQANKQHQARNNTTGDSIHMIPQNLLISEERVIALFNAEREVTIVLFFSILPILFPSDEALPIEEKIKSDFERISSIFERILQYFKLDSTLELLSAYRNMFKSFQSNEDNPLEMKMTQRKKIETQLNLIISGFYTYLDQILPGLSKIFSSILDHV